MSLPEIPLLFGVPTTRIISFIALPELTGWEPAKTEEPFYSKYHL